MNAPVVTIDGHESVPVNNERALMKAVAHQPVSVAIDAGGSDLQFYSEVYMVFIYIYKREIHSSSFWTLIVNECRECLMENVGQS